jgi:YidC/Oxa1 family membrane protein insertase
MNQKIAEVYQTNQVNPLAGCIPSLVQIPVFIGLYRAVLDLAKEDKLNEGFLWLPSLEGPVYDADPTKGSQWLFNWVDGAPALGWDDTLAFLVLPVLLVISQFVSMELMTPKDQQQQGNIVLKLLPLMIGWFSLNVPSALCLYWMVNNIVTTATSLIIRSNMPPPATISTSGSATASPPPTDIFAPPPMREKPAGFSSSSTPSVGADGVKPITSVDAEIVDDEDDDDDGSDDASESAPSESSKKVRT